MLAKVPVVLKDDADEEWARSVGLEAMRRCVANKWMEVIKSRDYLPSQLFEDSVESIKAVLANAIEIHGMEIPFCFDPAGEAISPLKQPSSESKPDFSSSLTSSSASKSCVIPHEIKFLVNQTSVWSVAKAMLNKIGQVITNIIVRFLNRCCFADIPRWN